METVSSRFLPKRCLRIAVPNGNTQAYASLVGEGDRASGGGGPRVTRGDKFGGQVNHAISIYGAEFCAETRLSQAIPTCHSQDPLRHLRWPSSPTREAYTLVTESMVSLLFLRPVDEDPGSPAASVRRSGEPSGRDVCNGTTQAYASLRRGLSWGAGHKGQRGVTPGRRK